MFPVKNDIDAKLYLRTKRAELVLNNGWNDTGKVNLLKQRFNPKGNCRPTSKVICRFYEASIFGKCLFEGEFAMKCVEYAFFESSISRRRRTWRWIILDSAGSILMSGEERSRPEAQYKAARATLQLLLTAPYRRLATGQCTPVRRPVDGCRLSD